MVHGCGSSSWADAVDEPHPNNEQYGAHSLPLSDALSNEIGEANDDRWEGSGVPTLPSSNARFLNHGVTTADEEYWSVQVAALRRENAD
eukprot:11411567-Karenia_brevis.AAC.1